MHDMTVLELAISVVCTRRPLSPVEDIAAEVSRWFSSEVRPAHIEMPLHRLVARADVAADGHRYQTTETGRERAETMARSLVHLVFRDRYFFDVGKLLDVTLVKEDGHAQ